MDDVLTALHEIRDQLIQLNEAILPRRSINRDDAAIVEALVLGIAGRIGSANFTVAELFADPTFKALIAGRTPTAMGNAFARIENQDLHGFRLERIGTERNRVVWRLLKALGSQPT